ncbi:Predicted acetyltransferase, GNAT superfamily [Bradyrhizobium erythrophlei]|jgi:predicted GNAT family acetyltransferase|nr:Predicted acetyltransferase, GNAT superfamily [Bradyrhizobium erythrophlei]
MRPRRKGKSADRATNPQSVAVRPDTRLAPLAAAVAGRPSLTGLLTLSADERGRQKVESDIRDNSAISRFEMPLSDGALAVACYKVEDGRIVLLHTEVLQEPSGLGYGSRLAHGVFEALRCDGKRVIVKCPFMSSYAARHPEYGTLFDG